MLPKPIDEIEWKDVVDLVGRREEDQTIEFKSSFKGGPDFLGLSDSKQKAALESLTTETIAFLNAQGGDVVIGIREAENAHPLAVEVICLPNVRLLVDRIAQAISARIEPFQSVVQVRAITSDDGPDGVIVIRAPSSLRAPHRSRESKECYVRRGREAVPVPMDEIQDLTLSRAHLRSERFSLLDKQFSVLTGDTLGGIALPHDRCHLRLAFVPLLSAQIELSQDVMSQFSGGDPKFYQNGRELVNDVAFRSWYGQWKPIVRGRRSLHLNKYEDRVGIASKEILEAGVMAVDFADNYRLGKNSSEFLGTHLSWVLGFFANAISSIEAVIAAKPVLGDGLLRLGARFPPEGQLQVGENHWTQHYVLPEGVTLFPDMEIRAGQGFDEAFEQAQVDFCAAAGLDWKPASFKRPA